EFLCKGEFFMRYNLKRLTESAILLAIAMVLSLFEFAGPWVLGGSITFCSMLPIVIIAWRYGTKWGLLSAFAFSLIQLVLGINNVQYAPDALTAIGIILLDYVLAYGVLGFSAMFRKSIRKPQWAIVSGIIVTFSARFLCHFFSGLIIWEALWPNGLGWAPTVWSLAYNASYMVPEMLITGVVAFLLFKPLQKYWLGEDLTKTAPASQG
ncbi:MAG: energy-coupled thiamine transporter ThiT, partial [Candidatus Limiplasma sp.]|nr:energy-coupled thiamine transporter ThiT [Candidatus Limiplasma sp.]